MDKITLKKLLTAAAGVPLILPASPGTAAETSPDSTSQGIFATAQDVVMVLRGKAPSIDANGNASFIVDLTRLNPVEFIRLVASDKTVVVFRGDPKSPETICPWFDLASRPYDVRQIDPDQPIYRVTAKISPDEAARVEAAGCLMTRTINRSDIKPYQP